MKRCPLGFGFVFFEIRGQTVNTLNDAGTLDFDHLGEEGFVSLGCISAQVAFADFGANQLARPGHAKPLDRGFVGFQFNFAS